MRTTLADPPTDGLRQETSSYEGAHTHVAELTEADLALIGAGMIVSVVGDHQHDCKSFLSGSTP